MLAVPGYAHAPFSRKFLMGFCLDGPVNAPTNFAVRSFTLPEIRAIAVLGWGCESPELGKRRL